MKITYSTDKIHAFGGVNFTDQLLSSSGIYDTIDTILGSRGLTASYNYSDLIRTFMQMVLCGGQCAEDITTHTRKELEQIKGFKVCSADKEVFVSKSGITHEFNSNLKMNTLLVNLLLSTNHSCLQSINRGRNQSKT